MVLWITGAKGLLGSSIAGAARGFCIGTGREVDISSSEAVSSFIRKHPGITHIVNCAAYTAVDLAESQPEEAHRANAIGPENLARAALGIGARLVHISTDYVFGGEIERPRSETDPVSPINTYGKTKLEGEERVQKVFPEACILRVSWIYGQGGKNFVAKLLELLQTQKEIPLNFEQRGRPTYAPDLARAILQLLDKSGLYQFANTGVATKYEFGLAMKEEAMKLGYPVIAALCKASSSSFVSPCKRPLYSAFDTTKIERELGIMPRHWRETLKEFLVEHAPAQ